MVGVVAELGRQVECDRQRRLPLAEQKVEAGVGLLRRPVAGELPHGPQLAAVHGGVRPAGERRLTWPSQPCCQVIGPADHVGRGVDGGDGDARVRGDCSRATIGCRRVAGLGTGAGHGTDAVERALSSTSATTAGSAEPAGNTADTPSSRKASASRAGIVPPTTNGTYARLSRSAASRSSAIAI